MRWVPQLEDATQGAGSGGRGSKGPAVLVPHDPAWVTQAQQQLAQLRHAFAELVAVRECVFEHIGSTAVPGLDAKPYVDLQIRVPTLPDPTTVLDAVVAPLGWVPARGAIVARNAA